MNGNSDKAKSVKCTQDLRGHPPSDYNLPGDGQKRTAEYARAQRQRLAMLMSTYAHGDGSGISVGAERLAHELGWHRATIFRRQSELREMGLLVKVGYACERGTVLQRLDLSAFDRRSGVASSGAGVASTVEPKSQVAELESQLATAGVASSGAGVAPSCVTTVLPPTETTPTTTDTAGVVALNLEKRHLAEIGRYGKRKAELENLIAEHGAKTVAQALAAIVKVGFDGAESKVGVTLYRLPEYIAKVKAAAAAAVRKADDDAFQQASIERQTAEIVKRMQAGREDGPTVEEFFKED